MHPEILQFINDHYYKKIIKTDESVVEENLKEFELEPYLMIQTPENVTKYVITMLNHSCFEKVLKIFSVGIVVCNMEKKKQLQDYIK